MARKRRTKKERRHSGRITPKFAVKGKYSKLIKDGLEPQEFWDDWEDYRDGTRGDDDRKHIRKIHPDSFLGRHFNIKRWNEKLKKLVNRRKAIKIKRLLITKPKPIKPLSPVDFHGA